MYGSQSYVHQNLPSDSGIASSTAPSPLTTPPPPGPLLPMPPLPALVPRPPPSRSWPSFASNAPHTPHCPTPSCPPSSPSVLLQDKMGMVDATDAVTAQTDQPGSIPWWAQEMGMSEEEYWSGLHSYGSAVASGCDKPHETARAVEVTQV